MTNEIRKLSLESEKGFYLGDPCYAIKGSEWQTYLDEMHATEEDRRTVVSVNDGSYALNRKISREGMVLTVDSGLIGLIPAELATVNDEHLMVFVPGSVAEVEINQSEETMYIIVDGDENKSWILNYAE